MPSKRQTITDALVTVLNAGSYTATFTATRNELGRYDHATTDTLTVAVQSGTELWEKQTRGNVYLKTYQPTITIKAPVATDTNANANADSDTHRETLEEIAAHLATQTVANLALLALEIEDDQDDLLYQAGHWHALIRLTYKDF